MARIEGERIVLREYEREDLPYVVEWANDTNTVKMLSDQFMYPRTEEQCLSWIEMCMKGFDERSLHVVIAEKQTREFIGQIDLMNINWKNRSATLGIVLGPKRVNQGYGSDAIRTLLRFAFSQMNLHRVQLEVHADNARGIACYKNCGFTQTGRRREVLFQDGVYKDLLTMDILEQEFFDRFGR